MEPNLKMRSPHNIVVSIEDGGTALKIKVWFVQKREEAKMKEL